VVEHFRTASVLADIAVDPIDRFRHLSRGHSAQTPSTSPYHEYVELAQSCSPEYLKANIPHKSSRVTAALEPF
jgi:hypothetical protein